MSIFKKDCPECAASNSVDAIRCRCGYCFEPDALAGNDAAEYAEEQDRLYRDYLDARIVQAEVELTVAREQAKADTSNTYKAAAALVAEQALNALRAEMKQLALRGTRRTRTAPPHVAKPAPAAARPAAPNKPIAAPAPIARPLAAPPAVNVHKAAPAKNPAMPPASNAAPVATPNRAAVAGKAKAVAVAAVRAVSKMKAKVVAVAAGEHRRYGTPAQPSATPSARFRDLQAQKAEAIAKSKTPPAHPEIKRPANTAKRTAPSSSTTQQCPSCTATVANGQPQCRCGYVFSQATQGMPGVSLSGLALLKAEATQECPSCTATLSAGVKRCKCGYTFSDAAEQIPALALDATALAILTDGISAGRTSRRR